MIIVTDDLRSILGIQFLENIEPRTGIDSYYSRVNVGGKFDGAADIFNAIYKGTKLRGVLVPIIIGNDHSGRVMISLKNIVDIPGQTLVIEVADIVTTISSMHAMGKLFNDTNLINVLKEGIITDEDIDLIRNYRG